MYNLTPLVGPSATVQTVLSWSAYIILLIALAVNPWKKPITLRLLNNTGTKIGKRVAILHRKVRENRIQL